VKRLAALMVLAATPLLSGCGGASEEEVARLEARVSDLESQVDTLEEETAAVRAIGLRLDDVEELIDGLRARLPDLDELRALLPDLEGLRGLLDRLEALEGILP
jgi:Tfp pilus assembly protein PilO